METVYYDFLFGFAGIVYFFHELLDHAVPLIEFLAVLLSEVPRDGHLQAFRSQLQVHDQIVKVDEVGLHDLAVSAILHHFLR